MIETNKVPVDALAQRLRDRVVPLQRIETGRGDAPGSEIERLRSEVIALRVAVQGYREEVAERRGAWKWIGWLISILGAGLVGHYL